MQNLRPSNVRPRIRLFSSGRLAIITIPVASVLFASSAPVGICVQMQIEICGLLLPMFRGLRVCLLDTQP